MQIVNKYDSIADSSTDSLVDQNIAINPAFRSTEFHLIIQTLW